MSNKNQSLLAGRARFVAVGVLALAALAGLFVLASAQESIEQTRHNLLPTAPGAVPAESRQQLCIFCHTPHVTSGTSSLWDPHASAAAYTPYSSPALKTQSGRPTGSSMLCLSCHDGAIAPGDTISKPKGIVLSGTQAFSSGDGASRAPSAQHPVSFPYTPAMARQDNHLRAPGDWDPRVQLDDAKQVQCTTCHDPHNDQFGNFTVMDNQGAALCLVCHDFDFFATTPHATSTRQWNGNDTDPWAHTDYPDVRTNACLNCHTPHHAAGREALLVRTPEEEVCFACHNGNVARFDLESVFQKPSHHPLEWTQDIHQAGEKPSRQADHVECADCHNPHRASRAPATAPNVKGVLAGVSGVDTNGLSVTESRYEYEICFKCHGYNRKPPLNAVARRTPSFNLLRAFAPTSASFHPVETPGRNRHVPSLILPLTSASIIYCTDCHNNDQARPSLPGSYGPHGSSYEYLLSAQYRTGDAVPESLTAYALCYKCHSRTSILANQSFRFHRLHIVDQRTPCSVCHDAHGIDGGQGNTVNNAHLMNFDASIVRPDAFTKRLEYRAQGLFKGQCFLNCHGVNHSPFSY